jgi:hypothetical protein
VVNALTGAALGAGTKMLIDKFTSKPNVSKTPAQLLAEKNSLAASKNASASDPAKKLADAAINKVVDAAKPSVIKPKAPTSVVKPPVLNPSTGLPTGTGFGDEKEEFTTDSLGNVYKTMPDGTSSLYRAAEVADESSVYPVAPPSLTDKEIQDELDRVKASEEPFTQEPQYFQDPDGNIYLLSADGGYELYRAAEVDADISEEPFVNEETYFNDGNGNTYVLNDSGEYELYRAAEAPEDITEDDYDLFNPDYNDYYDVNDRYSTIEDDGDQYYDYRRGGLTTMMKKGGGVKGYEGGGPAQYNDDDYRTYYDYPITLPDSEENVFDDGGYSDANGAMVENEDGTYTYKTWAELDEIAGVPAGTTYGSEPTSPWYKDLLGQAGSAIKNFTGMSQETLDKITGALPAAGAGALVASLLGSDFGGSENQNQGLDMSKVGLINPRTTDFGVGPTKFVGYEDYGTGGGDYAPNEELLRNLNAPGFNPVNEGDYGYEEVPAEAPKMASGGLSSMATPVASYYTFGQPADILANLGMRAQPPMNSPDMMAQVGQQKPPQQAQQQGLPQQMPQQMAQQTPQGMPQQGMMPQQQGMPPPMRKGGLPHASNVPMVEGRMDFRQGSAVHGEGDGQSDDIPAMLADGEYVIDAETVAQIGNGSTKAGAQALDKFREGIRAHKRSAPLDKIPPKTKALTSYLKGAR